MRVFEEPLPREQLQQTRRLSSLRALAEAIRRQWDRIRTASIRTRVSILLCGKNLRHIPLATIALFLLGAVSQRGFHFDMCILVILLHISEPMSVKTDRDGDSTRCFVVVGSQPASVEERAECKQIDWVSRVLRLNPEKMLQLDINGCDVGCGVTATPPMLKN